MTLLNTPRWKISEMKMQDQVCKLQRAPQQRDWENGPVPAVRVLHNSDFLVQTIVFLVYSFRTTVDSLLSAKI